MGLNDLPLRRGVGHPAPPSTAPAASLGAPPGPGTGAEEQAPADRTPSDRGYEARYRAVFDQSPVPKLFCDLAGLVTEVNDAFGALVGFTHQQVIGRHVRDLAHADDVGRADRILTEALRAGTGASRVLGVLRDSEDRPVPVLAHARAVRDEDGTVLGFSLVLDDLAFLTAAEQREKTQEEFFATMTRRASDAAFVTDVEGVVHYASPGVTQVLGYSMEEMVGTVGWSYVHPDDLDRIGVVFAGVAAGGATETSTLRVRHADGEWRWVEETFQHCATLLGRGADHQMSAGVVCNLHDISERVFAEVELKASELLYRSIAENVDEGLCLVNEDGTTAYVNDRMGRILGLSADDIHAGTLDDLLGVQQSRLLGEQARTRTGPGPARHEVVYDHPDGAAHTLLLVAAALDPRVDGRGGTLAMVSDVTRTRQLEGELRRAALYDSLVGLPNRALMMDRLEHALGRETRRTAVLFVDLDQFKLVNDARGHAVGDDVLVQVAARLSTCVRPSDTVARLGGDEFVVICEDVDVETAGSIAEELLAVLARPLTVPAGTIQLTASIGVACSPPRSAEALVRNADTAMYTAKVGGRNRIQHFDAVLSAHTTERRELGAELGLALTQDELTMSYQPVIDLRSGRVVGMEALARWERPGGEQVPPDRFVPVAEETGLAHQLDRWALRHALTEVRQLRAEGAVHPDSFVAVNLSARNLSNVELEDELLEWTAAAGLSAGDVLLEITETAIMADATAAVALLQRLRAAGFLVAVDDFGTGHSSLAYLRNLPLSTLKIDRSFIAVVGEDRNVRAITASIIDMAVAMGFSVIAEGVETTQQADVLASLGCHWAQGWLWSPAVTSQEARRSRTMVRDHVRAAPPTDLGSRGDRHV